VWRHQYPFVPVECYLYFLFEGLFWWMGIKFAVLKQGAPTSLILWDTWHKIYSSWAKHNNIRCKNLLTLVKFRTKNLHVRELNNQELRENWHTATHTLLIAYMQLHLYFWHLLSIVGKSQSKKCAHHAAKYLWGSWKVAHGREYFACGCKWNYV